jgi:hypothetical protein
MLASSHFISLRAERVLDIAGGSADKPPPDTIDLSVLEDMETLSTVTVAL